MSALPFDATVTEHGRFEVPLAPPMVRKIIRADGAEIEMSAKPNIETLRKAIGADCLDLVQLRHLGRPAWIMLVDDSGHSKNLEVNAKATALYHANCRTGVSHPIRGDVAIVLDEDFGS